MLNGMNPHVADLVLPEDWRYRAVCDTGTAEEHYASDRTKLRAIARCVTCPVLRQCREWAVIHNELHGIWGGTTPEQRKRIRRSAGLHS